MLTDLEQFISTSQSSIHSNRTIGENWSDVVMRVHFHTILHIHRPFETDSQAPTFLELWNLSYLKFRKKICAAELHLIWINRHSTTKPHSNQVFTIVRGWSWKTIVSHTLYVSSKLKKSRPWRNQDPEESQVLNKCSVCSRFDLRFCSKLTEHTFGSWNHLLFSFFII